MVFPLIFAAAAAGLGASLLSNVQHDHNLNVNVNGEAMVAKFIRELNLNKRLEDMHQKHAETLDGMTANMAQMTTNVETSLSSATADLHDAIFYFKIFMIALSVYYVLKCIGVILRWIQQRGVNNYFLIVLPAEGGLINGGDSSWLSLPRSITIPRQRGRNAN